MLGFECFPHIQYCNFYLLFPFNILQFCTFTLILLILSNCDQQICQIKKVRTSFNHNFGKYFCKESLQIYNRVVNKLNRQQVYSVLAKMFKKQPSINIPSPSFFLCSIKSNKTGTFIKLETAEKAGGKDNIKNKCPLVPMGVQSPGKRKKSDKFSRHFRRF